MTRILVKRRTNAHCKSIRNIFAAVRSSILDLFWVRLIVCLGNNLSFILKRPTLNHSSNNSSERARDVEVLVGTNKLSAGGTRYNTNKTFIHENYTKSNYAYDIALLRVQTPIDFNSKVQPIKISPKVIHPGTKLKVTGWGYTTVINGYQIISNLKKNHSHSCLFNVKGRRQKSGYLTKAVCKINYEWRMRTFIWWSSRKPFVHFGI